MQARRYTYAHCVTFIYDAIYRTFRETFGKIRGTRNFNFNFAQGQYFSILYRYIFIPSPILNLFLFIKKIFYILTNITISTIAKQIRQLVTISTISLPLSSTQPRPTSQYISFSKGKIPKWICLHRYNAQQPFTQRLLTSPKKKGREGEKKKKMAHLNVIVKTYQLTTKAAVSISSKSPIVPPSCPPH